MAKTTPLDQAYIDGNIDKFLESGDVYAPGFGVIKPIIRHNPRFPNMNQAKHCWVSFIDLHSCYKKYGMGTAECQSFLYTTNAICPKDWVGKWTEQLEKGIFAGQELIFKEKYPLPASAMGVVPWPHIHEEKGHHDDHHGKKSHH